LAYLYAKANHHCCGVYSVNIVGSFILEYHNDSLMLLCYYI